MRRLSFLLSVLAIALLGMVAVTPQAMAQDEDESSSDLELGSMDSHPLVGTWIVTDESGDPTSTPSIVSFTSDGTVVDLEVGLTTAGVWEETGDDSGDATFAGFTNFNGTDVTVIIRISAEVDEDDVFTADYSVTVVASDGTVLFSDTGTATGTRMEVEPVEAGGSTLNGLPTWVTQAADTGDAATDATAEPTEEVTGEPTEEPTAEATEEPTDEPTEEPTTEATPDA